MDFDFSEHHELLRKTVRDFARSEVAPHARKWDEEERFPKEIVPKLAELGLLGIRIPEEYGGSGMDTTSYAICVEEIARVDGSLALTVASHNGLGTGHILSFGTEAQKKKYLPKAATRRVARGVGAHRAGQRERLGRPRDHGAPRRRRLGHQRHEDVHHAGLASAASAWCSRAPTRARRSRRASPRSSSSTGRPGFPRRSTCEKLGCRSSDTVELTFENVRRAATSSASARSITASSTR